MHAEFAAGIDQAIYDQQPQHLFPTHRFTPFGQTLLPKLIQTQLLPEFAPQPAVAKHARTLQLQPAQPHLYAVNSIGRKFPVIGKQTQRGESLFGFVKHIQRLPPCCLLPIVDLAEIEHRALRCLTARQPSVLNDAEVSMILAVLAPVCAAQKHLSAAACQTSKPQKRGKVFTWPVSAVPPLKAKGILLREDR